MARRSMLRTKTGLVLAPLVAAVTLATGCGGSSDGGGQQGTPALRGGQLTVLSEDVPSTLDLDSPGVAPDNSQTGVVNTMEPLVYFAKGEVNDEGIQLLDFDKIEGRLAESWEFDKAAKTWTFKLREGVKSCEGNPFTADDVVYTFQRAKSASGGLAHAWFLANQLGIKGFQKLEDPGPARELKDTEVEKLDDFTVRFHMTGENPLVLTTLAHFGLSIFDKEGMEAHKTAKDPWSHEFTENKGVASFGPYCVESWKKHSEFVATANPNYFRGKPAVERVVYRAVPSTANRVAAVRSGAGQLAEHLTPSDYDSLRDASDVEVGGVYGNQTLMLQMNWKVKPLQSEQLRDAIGYAIPYQDIIDRAYFGRARVWKGVMPSTYPGYSEPSTQYTYDPERAKQLLAEAGFPGGKGLEAFKDAVQLSYVTERASTLEPVATLMRDALKGVGIPAELNPMPQAQYADARYNKKTLATVLDDAEKPVVPSAAYGIALLFVSNKYGPPSNNTNYSNPRVDDLVFKLQKTTDGAKRDEIMAEIQDIVMEDGNFIPIAEYQTQWAYSPALQGLTWNTDNTIRWFDLRLGA
jgi:peptide/nickel transport system substrate-binding protein